jgi:alpha-methylacyl-CoA racemase
MEAARHPHLLARGIYAEHQGRLQAAPAPRFDGAAYAPGAACEPGEHTQEVLDQLTRNGPQAVWR